MDEAEKLWQQVIHPFGQEIHVPDEAAVCYWKNLHPSWQVWRGSDEAASLWQQVIHPFGQKIQVSDEAAAYESNST
ncbi:MAG: hypothetical protein GX685_02275 [Clostridiales bacterium]|nr:hypothetical protein [Clostridiales bacterium]